MALQQINWTQIDTERVPSGSLITLASPEFPFEAVYAKNLRTSGSIIVSGSKPCLYRLLKQSALNL